MVSKEQQLQEKAKPTPSVADTMIRDCDGVEDEMLAHLIQMNERQVVLVPCVMDDADMENMTGRITRLPALEESHKGLLAAVKKLLEECPGTNSVMENFERDECDNAEYSNEKYAAAIEEAVHQVALAGQVA